MLDTIISDPKLLERKPNYQRVLSRAYAIESIYFVERQRFEEALRLLNKVDPTHVDTEGFSVEIYKQAIIGAINTINRQNDIYKIKTITSNITDADYFDSSHTSDNKYDLVDELREFQEFWKVIKQMGYKYQNDEEVTSLITQLEKEVVRVQKKEFPILRKQYTKILAAELWIKDIDVYCNGNGNTILSIIGYEFYTRSNIAETQNSIAFFLKLFRFKKTIYYWHQGYESTHSYNLDTSDDGNPVTSVSNY